MNNDALRVLDWHALDVRLVWVYEGAPIVPRGKVGGNRQIGWLVRKGTATVYHEGASVRAGAGDWLFPPQGEIERSFSKDAVILSVSVSMQWSNRRFLIELDRPLTCPSERFPTLEQLANALLQTLREVGVGSGNDFLLQRLNFQSYLQCNRMLLSWAGAYVECLSILGVEPYIMASPQDRPKQIMERLDAWPVSEAFDAKVLSDMAGVSHRQLNRVFKAAYGITPREYWNRRRLGCAMAALNGMTKSIKQIAYECGFASPALFTRWFTHQAGVSPTVFRHKKGNPQSSVTPIGREVLRVPPAKADYD